MNSRTGGRGLLIGALLMAVGGGFAATAGAQVADVDGTTPLHSAVRRDDVATAKQLIKAGADVKAATRYGVSPMGLAAMNGSAAMLRVLLDAGANPNTATPSGETAVMTAARTGKADAVALLLDRGANVNATDTRRGQTALMWAAIENHVDVAKLLLARGADINARTSVTMVKGEYVPVRSGGAAGVGLFRHRAPPTPGGGMTALLFAARDGKPEMVRLLLDHKADIQLSTGNHTSPLLIALLNGQMGIATELLARGADPNATDDYRRAALFAAVELRNFNYAKYTSLRTDGGDPLVMMKTLLEKGANPNQKTDTVPVHGWMQADASWMNFDGHTPFFRAAFSGDIEGMRLLLEYGADPNIPTTLGSTPLMAATGLNWVEVQTFTRSEAEYIEAVRLCLDRGADVNAANSQGLTALHAAANRGWASIIQILADRGAAMDPRDSEGRTPMTFAEGIFLAAYPPVHRPETIALLKRLGASPSPVVPQ